MTHHITQSQASEEVRRQDSWKVKALSHLSLCVTVFAMFMLAAFVLSLILQGVDAI